MLGGGNKKEPYFSGSLIVLGSDQSFSVKRINPVTVRSLS